MKTGVIFKMFTVLLVLVMSSTMLVSPTLARYATNVEMPNVARVAKWGVTVTYPTDSSNTTFSTKYYGSDHASAPNRYAPKSATSGITVSSSDTEDVLAPGTWSYFPYPATFSGTPEVAVRASFTADLELTGWELENGDEYCPLIFSIDYGTTVRQQTGLKNYKYYYIGGTKLDNKTVINDIDDLQDAVNEAAEAAVVEFEANTNLNDYKTNVQNSSGAWVGGTIRVFWAWPYSASGNVLGTATGTFKNIADHEPLLSDPIKDTYLCDLPTDDNADNDPRIKLSSSCTIEQID